jgi:hypothetical protein
VPPRRALAAMGHVALGIALGAAVWMPLAARILEYGQHFPNPIRTPARLLEDLLVMPSPVTHYAMLSYAGYFGILAGLWSRRAAVVYVSATALVLLVGLCDAPYLALELAPGQGVARLGTERLAQLARPFVAAAGAYGIALFFSQVRAGWREASHGRRLIAAAVIGVLAGALARNLPAFWHSASARAFDASRELASDPQGRAQLARWARARAAELRPDAWARAMFETDTHEHFHLTAVTGLPSFHLAPQPDLLLRERIQDASPESLRRFNVRWAIAQNRSPAHGDPATERVLGSFRIRELPGWDGQLARIERGTGTVTVTRLDDTAVEIEVLADAPVLVALGTGHYPRWRARHASGAAEPVYALPSRPGSFLHVVSAWVLPGRTTFTADGPLPSDGRGLPLTVLALLAAVAGTVVWSAARWRGRVLRRLARLRGRARAGLPRLLRAAARIGVPLLLLALLVRGCRDEHRPARALELGSGLRGTATVEARGPDGAWRTCGYARLPGSYVCDGLAVAYDAMAGLLNDAPPSWGFNTPAIAASAYVPGVELRVRLRERLAGRYWMAASEGTVALRVGDEPARDVDRAILDYADAGERSIELRAAIPTTWWSFTFVREDTLFSPRDHLRGPPAEPPPELSARAPIGPQDPGDPAGPGPP